METAKPCSRPRLSMSLIAVLLVSISLFVPGVLFGWMAWRDRTQSFHEARASTQRTVHALHEHALRTLETGEVLLRQIDRQVSGRDWGDLAGDPGLHYELAEIVRTTSGVRSLSLVDAHGVVRASGQHFPAVEASVADRDYFGMLSSGTADMAIGSAVVGRTTGERVFPLAIRRSVAEGGSFDGVLVIGIAVDYFTSFWKQFAPTLAHVIPMMREDGVLIARYPATLGPSRLSRDGPFMRRIAQAPAGFYTAVSQVDGVERMNAYAKLGKYPLYLAFSLETAAVEAAWRAELETAAWLTALVIAMLLALGFVLVRYMHREQTALEKWRDAARRLAGEMERRQAAEETLRQAQKMEAIGQITGGVAHDFNNVLQVLSTNLHLARRTAPNLPAAGFISSALNAMERGAKLTRQLLAFSRRQPLRPEPVRLEALLEDMGGLLRTTLGDTIGIRVHMPRDAWPAMIDRNQAEMAILNVALNARDAMPEGGVLRIHGVNVRVAEHEAGSLELAAGDYVRLSLSDTGQGMGAEVLKRAVEPFFTTKQAGKGSGLGLSQVHGFTAQSGGSVRLESSPGQGTTVKLYLPRAQDAAEPAARARGPARMPRREAILLVDDDADVRTGIAAGLTVLGHSVLEAGGGQDALALLRKHPELTLLITDYAMPGMNGAELAERARKRRPSLRILLVSGFADLPDDEALRWDLLRKPFSPEELADCIADLPPRRATARREVVPVTLAEEHGLWTLS